MGRLTEDLDAMVSVTAGVPQALLVGLGVGLTVSCGLCGLQAVFTPYMPLWWVVCLGLGLGAGILCLLIVFRREALDRG